MRPLVLVGLAPASPALGGYAVLAPLAAHYLDQRFQLQWTAPEAARVIGLAAVCLGCLAGLWALHTLESRNKARRDSLEPDELVTAGPYRLSRNPLMLGCALAGFGLALALASPVLTAAYVAAAFAAVGYVTTVEEPLLENRFGAAYREYARRTPRWLGRVR